ncbi:MULTISPECIES: sensor histidine kinase [unclassified Streptomyces]|uniref:sensor histidine kinase n=1 Tax=unclassified Streptomyces TaxID=2593676 RepID=UPI00386F1053|nr:sensor histidine kinase [Streptomyces sp. NBC_00988]WSX55597.1 sensor histidine kinase [Streptomyces sp. NBC_00986]
MTHTWLSWWTRHDRVRDAFPAALLVAIAVVANAAGKDGWHLPRAEGVGWTVLACAPLVVRSRWPLAVVVVTLGIDLAHMANAPGYWLAPAASLVALYTFATHTDRRSAWAVGLTATIAITTTYAMATSQPAFSAQALARLDLAIAATALGDAVGRRRIRLARVVARAEDAERTREEEARRRVTEERIRIARDLHDVVAHHITLVNAQAGVAQHLMRTDPDTAYQALAHIKENSSNALDELRAMVGLLRESDDAPEPRHPLPSLSGLDDLVDSFRTSGLPVEVVRSGEPEWVAPTTDLTAYRIIQEALTNAHKHAAATHVQVALDYRPESLRITVTDDGRPGTANGAGTGHGLIGMRERAAAIGGKVTARPRPEGGFHVFAELPVTLSSKGS